MNLAVEEMREALASRPSKKVLAGATIEAIGAYLKEMTTEESARELLGLLVDDYKKLSIEMSEQADYLDEMTEMDPMLAIRNRHSMLEVVNKEWEGSKRYHSPTSLIMFSVDKLDRHREDEEALDDIYVELAQLIKTSTRLTDTFGKLDHNVFLIVVPTTNNLQATWLSGKLRESVQRFDFGTKLPVTCSFGIADSGDSMDPEDWLQITKDAYNKAVDEGGNTVIDYETIILK